MFHSVAIVFILQAFESSEFKHEWCAQHRMQLACGDAIDSQQILNNGIASIRRFVNIVKHSPSLRSKLATAQEAANVPKNVMKMVKLAGFLWIFIFGLFSPLLQDVSTRWDSTYEMVERFVEQKPAIDIVALDEKNVETELKTLSAATIIALKRMLAVLKPVKQFTKMVCCKNHAA
jgi:hypothetical protein